MVDGDSTATWHQTPFTQVAPTAALFIIPVFTGPPETAGGKQRPDVSCELGLIEAVGKLGSEFVRVCVRFGDARLNSCGLKTGNIAPRTRAGILLLDEYLGNVQENGVS